MKPEALLNAYFDLNILLLAGTILWIGARKLLARTTLGQSYRPQLRLLNAMTLILALAPIVALVVTQAIPAHPPNLSDILVAQYLQGNVTVVNATTLQDMLGLREELLRGLTSAQPIWAKVVWAAFAVGVMICLLQLALSVLRLRRVLAHAQQWRKIGRVHLLISDTVPVAFSSRGIWRKFVVLPSDLLTHPEDLRLTIAHELQHFRQRDIECEFLLEALRPVLFWNPAFQLWRREVRLLRELACDQSLAAQSRFDPRSYCECLIRACARASKSPVLFARRSPSVALVAQRELRRGAALQTRILTVTAAQPNANRSFGWGMVSALLLAVVLSTTVLLQRSADWSHDRLMLSTIVNLERMASRTVTVDPAIRAIGSSFTTASR